ncbi:ABC transporter permease subunit [Cellulomonas fimi]|uniref:ABC transporter permease subunit n=1 Tax=Cellulomonas fimi TaxID=1708 RepID=A0A7Y0LVM0_CELFI|nr:ABC transporter permease subunit [Cellulomonas fimi]NMR18696.1 ABC transporter permease subunit [Cellulomonas fimi]
MTTEVTLDDAAPTPGGDPAPSGSPAEQGPWSLSWHGVRTVAVLDLRQRVRSTRWVVALVVWFVVVGAVTALTWAAVGAAFPGTPPGVDTSGMGVSAQVLRGPTIFGVVVFFVLFLGLLVSPTLSATSINGDRAAGTLATLQVTLLTPGEIAVGKLVAAWVAALAFLAAGVPFLVVALAAGGTPVVSVVVCLVVLAVLLAVVCAIGLGFSALSPRTSGSAVLTFLAVAGLTVLSPIVFALTLPAVTQEEPVRVWTTSGDYRWDDDEPPTCTWQTVTMSRPHTERTWWLLAVNPFVILADAAPEVRVEETVYTADPLAAIRTGVREARTGPAAEEDWCGGFAELTSGSAQSPVAQSPVAEREPDRSVVWPWGLAANLALGGAGLAIAVRRLAIPQRTLPRGTRVA